ncbi:A disintegrin and metalloproteinase with thrombospondin motifs 3 [Varanus komodoensis]|nr:A disintegrin and metalloproteinase with thrombospondin motifs 3 [Varanus komodoensis]
MDSIPPGLPAGMIKTGEDEYFIEPLEKGKQMDEERGRLHVVYRRSAVAQDPTDTFPDFQSEEEEEEEQEGSQNVGRFQMLR